jgi:hypothetical protein
LPASSLSATRLDEGKISAPAPAFAVFEAAVVVAAVAAAVTDAANVARFGFASSTNILLARSIELSARLGLRSCGLEMELFRDPHALLALACSNLPSPASLPVISFP